MNRRGFVAALVALPAALKAFVCAKPQTDKTYWMEITDKDIAEGVIRYHGVRIKSATYGANTCSWQVETSAGSFATSNAGALKTLGVIA